MLSITLSSLLFSAFLASGVAASHQWVHVLPRELMPRQDQSFTPSVASGQGETCQDAFGAQSTLCAGSNICYKPSLGQVCCSEGYPCPNGSFCLVQGFCCPDGVDPQTCALDNGVTLPSDFGLSNNQAPATVITRTTASVEVSSAPASVFTPSAAPSSSASVAPPLTMPPKPSAAGPSGAGPRPAGTVSVTGSRPSSTLTPFTGAAPSLNVMGGLGALFGLAGVMAVL